MSAASKVHVLAYAGGVTYAIGPIEDVGSAVSDLKDKIEEAGFHPVGTVYDISPDDFGKMARKEGG